MIIRLFLKEFKVSNYCKAAFDGNKLIPKKTPRQEAHIFAEVYYTPKGWAVEFNPTNDSPIETWDPKHCKQLYGISSSIPEGIVREKNFNTPRAAQQWSTKRLREFGWEPEDDWHY